MKLRYALSLMITLGVAVFVAAAMAQQQEPQRRQAAQSRSVGSAATKSADFAPDVFQESTGQVNARQGVSFGSSPYSSTATAHSWQHAGLFVGEDAVLANEAGELIHKLEATDSDTERDEIKAKLSANLGKQFDSRQKRHEQEIKALEAKVKKLKELVSKRQESRSEIISRRLEQILRDSQGLGW